MGGRKEPGLPAHKCWFFGASAIACIIPAGGSPRRYRLEPDFFNANYHAEQRPPS